MNLTGVLVAVGIVAVANLIGLASVALGERSYERWPLLAYAFAVGALCQVVWS